VIALGLTGFPLDHSLSPRIQRAALDACGLAGDYRLYPVQAGDLRGLADLLARVRSGELAGLNVTIPHKETVLTLLDELTPEAQCIGAVNTLYMQGDRLAGANTDAPGFLADLKRFLAANDLAPLAQRRALVLGAGGAARAVVYALVNDSWGITLAARRPAQAEVLAHGLSVGDAHISTVSLDAQALAPSLEEIRLVVNATPLGMPPQAGQSPWPAGLPLPPHAAVYDLVYQPPETTLARQARAAGLPAQTGLGMLLEQAALSFELWTGRKVAPEILQKALEAA